MSIILEETMNSKCHICDHQPENVNKLDYGNKYAVDCKLCGKYIINTPYSIQWLEKYPNNKFIIAGHMYASREKRKKEYYLSVNEIEKIIKDPFGKPANVNEQLNVLLENIQIKTKYIGHFITYNFFDSYPIVYARNKDEIAELFTILSNMQLIHIIKVPPEEMKVKILFKGYQKLEEMQMKTKNPEKCFVAMQIQKTDELEQLYSDIICPVLEHENYTRPFRIDEDLKTEFITNKIIANIKSSSLFIAEVTPYIQKTQGKKGNIIQHNANVYYEAGFALGLNIPIIYLCREDMIKHLPFDTKTINHLTWKSENMHELKDSLEFWIEANVK